MHFAVIGMDPLKRKVGGKQKEKEERNDKIACHTYHIYI
jgi:hypothetical protein